MSPDAITPAGGIAELERPAFAGEGATVRRIKSFRYLTSEPNPSFAISVPPRPPLHMLLDVDVHIENGVIAMNARGVDVSIEAEDPARAFSELAEAVREWLEYLRDEEPQLAPDLEPQRRFVALLDHDPGTWFRVLYLV